MTTIRQMQDAAYAQSVKSGFWDDHEQIRGFLNGHPRLQDALDGQMVAAKLMLIVSEATEVLEEIRAGNSPTATYYREDGKPEGVPSELADIVIRVGDLSGALGIDLQEIVEEKAKFNAMRPHKHGKSL